MQRNKCKEIELSYSLEANKWLQTGRFIFSEENTKEISWSKKLIETEDDKVDTEKEIVLLVQGQ